MATAVRKTQPNQEYPLDEKWGYPFGIDGRMGTKETQEFFGGVSTDTLDNWYGKGLLRRVKIEGTVLYCRRAADELLRSRE